MAARIPDHVRRLIADDVDSVEQLEVLLLLRERHEREWSADEVSRELQSQPASAGARLADLAQRGYASAARPGAYRYQPKTAELARAVDDLADAYARRRHTIIALIFSSPSGAIQSFADAFRLRRD